MEFTPELIIDIKRFLKPDSTTFRMLHKGHEITFTAGDMMETIASQQAEIERLRAALGEIATLQTIYQARDMREIARKALGQPSEAEQDQPTPAELGEMAGKAEAVEEPLGIRVLQYLASADEPKTAFEVQDELHTFVNFVMVAHLKDRLIYRNNGKYSITQEGRDYLASLDKPEPTDAEIDAHINEQERLHLESIDYGTDDDGQPDFYDDGGYGDYYDLGLLGE